MMEYTDTFPELNSPRGFSIPSMIQGTRPLHAPSLVPGPNTFTQLSRWSSMALKVLSELNHILVEYTEHGSDTAAFCVKFQNDLPTEQ